MSTVSDKILQYFSFIMGMIAWSYAWHQRGILFVIPEGIYIGAFASLSFFQMYRSFKSVAWDYVMAGQLVVLIPIIIGLLAFSRLTKYRWLARYPVAVMAGVGVGALFGLSVRGQFLAIIGDTVTSMIDVKIDPFSKLLLVVLFVPTVLIFIYSKRLSNIIYEKGRPLYYAQRLGRIGLLTIVAYQTGIGVETRLIQTLIKPVVDDIARLLGLMV